MYRQVRDRFDSTFLALVRLRQIVLAGGAYVSYMMSISPIPNTKYTRSTQNGAGNWLGLNTAEARFKNRHILGGSASSLTFTFNNLDLEPVRAWLAVDDQQREQHMGLSRGGLDSSMGSIATGPISRNGYHDHPYNASYTDMDDTDSMSYTTRPTSNGVSTRPLGYGGYRGGPAAKSEGYDPQPQPGYPYQRHNYNHKGGDMETSGEDGGLPRHSIEWPRHPVRVMGAPQSYYGDPSTPGSGLSPPSKPIARPSTSSSTSMAATTGPLSRSTSNPTKAEQLAIASIQLLSQSVAPPPKKNKSQVSAAPWEVAQRKHADDDSASGSEDGDGYDRVRQEREYESRRVEEMEGPGKKRSKMEEESHEDAVGASARERSGQKKPGGWEV